MVLSKVAHILFSTSQHSHCPHVNSLSQTILQYKSTTAWLSITAETKTVYVATSPLLFGTKFTEKVTQVLKHYNKDNWLTSNSIRKAQRR